MIIEPSDDASADGSIPAAFVVVEFTAEQRQGASMATVPRRVLHDLLMLEGYRLAEDAWCEVGRCSYMHEDDATRSQFIHLGKVLRHLGWSIDEDKLRTFLNSQAEEIIDVEPGGAGTNGHFLHHMKIR